MKVLLSPAKALDYDKNRKVPFYTQAYFSEDADYLANRLSKMSQQELKSLLKLSEKLADLNYFRYKQWEKPIHLNEKSKPAITVFDGAAFRGFDVDTLTQKELEKAQNTVRILSGLYGVLKPLDLIYPYRLEMGTKWKIENDIPNLYAYWKNRMHDFFSQDVTQKEVLINLASSEYFKAIDQKQIKSKIITPIFKEFKEGNYKVVMTYAKTARGKMARNIVQKQYKNAEELKTYSIDGYSFDEQLSNEKEWVFVR